MNNKINVSVYTSFDNFIIIALLQGNGSHWLEHAHYHTTDHAPEATPM